MSFLLDTNICSAHLKQPRRFFSRFMQYFGNLNVSRLTLAELYAWALGARDPNARFRQIEKLTEFMEVVEFDDNCARRFGKLRVDLKNAGVTISSLDLLLASTALASALTIVTHNTRDFERIPDLRVEDWLVT